MILIKDPDNPLTDSDAPNQAEVHMKPNDVITIIGPGGGEIATIASDGRIYEPFGTLIKERGES